MSMTCVNGVRACDGCMSCQEEGPVFHDYDGEPIYEGETYYYIDGEYVHEDNILDFMDRYKMTARRAERYEGAEDL